MIDFIDLSVIEELKDWQLERAFNVATERVDMARQNLHDLNSWNASQEDMDYAQAELEELALCKGKIRAEMVRRHPNSLYLFN